MFIITGRHVDVVTTKREILSALEHFSQIHASHLGDRAVWRSALRVVRGRLAGTGGQVQVRVPCHAVKLKGATIRGLHSPPPPPCAQSGCNNTVNSATGE